MLSMLAIYQLEMTKNDIIWTLWLNKFVNFFIVTLTLVASAAKPVAAAIIPRTAATAQYPNTLLSICEMYICEFELIEVCG